MLLVIVQLLTFNSCSFGSIGILSVQILLCRVLTYIVIFLLCLFKNVLKAVLVNLNAEKLIGTKLIIDY